MSVAFSCSRPINYVDATYLESDGKEKKTARISESVELRYYCAEKGGVYSLQVPLVTNEDDEYDLTFDIK